ncbi:MAG: CinA family protein [Collinsella sp.]
MTESFEQIAAHNEELARDIVERASVRGVTVSTAESLTAGMIASTIADIPGASAVLRGGAVTYCDEIKHRVLGVDQETLDRYTAVSYQTAREMAAGSLELYQSDIAVSATGYAGPVEGRETHPAGTLYRLGVSLSRWGVPVVDSIRCRYEGDRSCVRAHAVAEALGRIVYVLDSME